MPFTAAKLPTASANKTPPEEVVVKKSETEHQLLSESKVNALKRKRKRMDIFGDSDTDSDDEKFNSFLKSTSALSKTDSNSPAKVAPAVVKDDKSETAVKKKSKSHKKDGKVKEKSSRPDAKKQSSAKTEQIQASKKTSQDSSKQLTGKLKSSLSSPVSRKRPLEKDETSMAGASADKKLRLVDIDFTGGKMKQHQQQQ